MTPAILIFLAILFVLVCMLRAARIGALVAFLFAGIISGPYVLNLFQLSDTWSFLGNLGILFLWFNLGLGINMHRLWEMRHTIFGFGAAQVLMVAVMLFPILAGVTPWSMLGCIMVALLLAMSSTSADMQLLTDRNQLNTNMGRQTFSILLFQDLLSIPLLAMLPVFAGKSFNLGATAIDILVLSIALIDTGRRCHRQIFIKSDNAPGRAFEIPRSVPVDYFVDDNDWRSWHGIDWIAGRFGRVFGGYVVV